MCISGATYGKPVHQGVNHLKPQRGLRSLAEERVGRRCGNLRVLNSYWINQDGVYKYYEVILVDPSHKAIKRDPRINWIANPVHKRREARGLTATGKKVRCYLVVFSIVSDLSLRTEPRSRQGSFAQPRQPPVRLEAPQQPFAPPLPVNGALTVFLLSACVFFFCYSFANYHHHVPACVSRCMSHVILGYVLVPTENSPTLAAVFHCEVLRGRLPQQLQTRSLCFCQRRLEVKVQRKSA